MYKIKFNKDVRATNVMLAGHICGGWQFDEKTVLSKDEDGEPRYFIGGTEAAISKSLFLDIRCGSEIEVMRYGYNESEKKLSFRAEQEIGDNKICFNICDCTIYSIDKIEKEDFEVIK